MRRQILIRIRGRDELLRVVSEKPILPGYEHSIATQKGFTGHEMLDDLGLIHMGGRVYDPTLARFLSTDPVVQQPHNLQNYNRYSYVLNNPVSYTDPTGYLIAEAVAYTVTAIIAVTYVAVQAAPYVAAIYFGARELGRLAAKNKFGGELLQIAVIVGCTVATSGAGTPACIAAGSGLAAASVAKANGASNHEALRFGLRAAAVAYVASVMMQGVSEATTGGGWENSFGRAYGYGVTSAWASAAMGGDPAAGFTSGFISPFVGGSAMLTGLAPGISSKLAGGKFEHGFVVGVTSYMFTHSAEQEDPCQRPTLRQRFVATMDNVVGKVWALPNTAIGFTVGILSLPFGSNFTVSRIDNAIVFNNFPIGPGGAITFGNVILNTEASLDVMVPTYEAQQRYLAGQPYKLSDYVRLGDHERAHTYQYQRLGIFFFPAYGLSGGITGRNQFEIAADRYATTGSGWNP